MPQRPLFDVWPGLERSLGFSTLGDFPTPVEPLAALVPNLPGPWAETFVKRDDKSSTLYGGNKVRTLEALFGQARRDGARAVFATGAYGSNHAVATVLHGQKLGFRAGALLFPQPFSPTAEANLLVCLARADELQPLFHWSALPFAMWRLARRARQRREPTLIMKPGGASPRGCLGFLSAALELGRQVELGLMPRPLEIVLAVGSTCSTAGLLSGLAIAARLGIGFGASLGGAPRVVAVRVTPWPVTSRYRIVELAYRTLRWLHQLTGDRVLSVERAELARGLEIDGGQIGRGYGEPTAAGLMAISSLGDLSAALDTTYAAKSAAGLLERVRSRPPCPRLFWSTKSSAPLPELEPNVLARAAPCMQRWLAVARPGAPTG